MRNRHGVIFRLLFGREVETMVAMLWVNQILLGKKSYADVPARLKEQVKELLTDAGKEDLVTE